MWASATIPPYLSRVIIMWLMAGRTEGWIVVWVVVLLRSKHGGRACMVLLYYRAILYSSIACVINSNVNILRSWAIPRGGKTSGTAID